MKFILFILFFSCHSQKKPELTKPKNHREEHVYKYTELFVNAQLAGKEDSAAYYFNIAMKYDSIYKTTNHQ